MDTDAPPLILHVIHHLVIGGMENGLVNLVNHMPAERYRHAIACVEDYSDFRSRIHRADVEVHALERTRIGAWRLRLALYRLCRRLRPAVVHTRNLSGLDALLPARLAGVPVCVHGEHGWDVDNLQGTRMKPLMLRRLHAPLVHRFVAVSRDIERFLVERVGVSAGRVTQIYNGVDTERFAPARDGRGALPFEAGDWVVGTVGRLQKVKDHVTLVRAFALARRAEPQAAARMRLAIVGDGPQRGTIEQAIRDENCADSVWLAGSRADVAQLMSRFDCFALTSLNEGISNTILEAMACGLPTLATRVGGNPELIDDGVSGELVPSCDAAAVAAALLRLFRDPARCAGLGAGAREAALRRFSLQRMVGDYVQLYDRALARHLRRGMAGAAPSSLS